MRTGMRALLCLVVFILSVAVGFAATVTDSSSNGIKDSSNNFVSDANGPTPVAPSILTQPVNAVVTAPVIATFSVTASGTPLPSYQWYQEAPGAGSFTAISGATASSYTTPATTIANSGTQYECVIINSAGSVTSNSVTLTVNLAITAPAITTQPVNATVNAPASATFSIAASGSPSPSYQWLVQSPGAISFTAISGATGASYTTPATTLANSGAQYECRVSNVAGSVTSYPATMIVNAAPAITAQPVNMTIVPSVTASFSISATGAPAPTYQWLQKAPGGGSFTSISGATGASYTTPGGTLAMNGTQYECVVTNTVGSVTSNPATLFIESVPAITAQPANVTVQTPSMAAFSVTATGTPAPSYQWFSKALGAGSFTAISGATASSYTTPATTTANSGTQYECVLSNTAGSVTSNPSMLTVSGLPAVALINPSAGVVLPSGANVTLVATASETNGSISSVAFYNGATLLATKSSAPFVYTITNIAVGAYNLTAKATDSWGSSTTSSTVTINVQAASPYANLVKDTSGDIVRDSSGNALTDSNPLAPVAPSITTQPVNATVTAPSTAAFSLTAAGSATLAYQWLSQAPGGGGFTAIPGATSASYTTSANSTANSGTQYECIITNTAGSVTSTAVTLTVNPPVNVSPVITVQPGNAAVIASASATFSVSAAGTPFPGYQWYSKAPGAGSFTAISGATSSSYTTPATVLSNSGTQYQCIVTNIAGTATSNAASLTVTGLPVVAITSPANGYSTSAGSNVTITAYASEANGTITNVAFYNGTTLLGTAAQSPYSYTLYNVPVGNFTLTAIATDSNGLSSTSSVVNMTISEGPPSVSLASNSGNYLAPAAIILTASAYQASGSITHVDFYNGAALLGSVTGSPYALTWNNVPAGIYSLTAKAYNDGGLMTVSNALTVSVATPKMVVQNTTYNANGQITQIQYGNGVTTAYTYNPLNFRLMRVYTSNAQAQVLQDLNYTYDALGQLMTVTDNVNTGAQSMNAAYTYDALNRLTSANGAYGNKTYAYDQIGNITQKDGLIYNYAESNSRVNNTGTVVGTAGPHAVTSLSDGTTFKYDLNGNMVTLQKGGNLTQYAYDSQNRLNKVTVGGLTAASYVYDGDGGRTEKTVVRRDLALFNSNVNPLLFGSVSNPLPATAANPTVNTTIDVGNLFETESGTNRFTKFIYMGSTRVASIGGDGSQYFYHTDHLGGTNVLTDSSGQLRELTEYDPFGLVTVHQKYGSNFNVAWYYFTGKPLDDETGLIFLGARYYNPSLGRFITPDTVVQAADNPQTLNRYTYCNNNPVNLTDPTGHSWWSSLWKAVTSFFKAVVKTIEYLANPVQSNPIIHGIVTGNWSYLGQDAINGGIGFIIGGPIGAATAIITTEVMRTPLGQWAVQENASFLHSVYHIPSGAANVISSFEVSFAVSYGVQSGLSGLTAPTQSASQTQSALNPDEGTTVSKYQLTANYDNEGQVTSFNLLPKDSYPSAGNDDTWWQYYPADNPGYKSNWVALGTDGQPPVAPGEAAQKAFNLPPWNPGTAARQIFISPGQAIAGPRTPMPQPQWGHIEYGTEQEYYLGNDFPKKS